MNALFDSKEFSDVLAQNAIPSMTAKIPFLPVFLSSLMWFAVKSQLNFGIIGIGAPDMS